MTDLKVFLRYAAFWCLFSVVFAVMFALLTAAAAGLPLGAMLIIFGGAALLFGETLIITELPAPFMLLGGLCAMCLAAALGLIAVKLGFFISRRFVITKRRCDILRDWN